jgi:hypothetical protein
LPRSQADYATSGTAGHDFFEPLTTNREDRTSEEDPEGPVCQPFPGYSMISVGDVGFRSVPAPKSIAQQAVADTPDVSHVVAAEPAPQS